MVLKVTPEYISQAASDCTSAAGDLDQKLAGLKQYVIAMQETWHGVAADTFGQLMTDYDGFARILHDSLVNIGSGLQGNFVNYHDTETTNINSLVAVNGSIPGANF